MASLSEVEQLQALLGLGELGDGVTGDAAGGPRELVDEQNKGGESR